MSSTRAVLVLAVLVAGACSAPPTPTPSPGEAPPVTPGPVTLAVINARVWTGDTERPWAEALAAAGDRLVAVGTTEEIRRLAGVARAIDAGGRLVTPGFIDAHIHFLQGGANLTSVQLRDARTREEFVRRIAAFAAHVPEGTWITGGDWDHELWGGELPRKDWIDRVTPKHPVAVNRLDGHMLLANSAAMRAAGVTRATPDVPGGTIVRDARGEPTGIFKDNATRLVERAIPDPTPAERDRALEAAMTHVAAQGVTSVHHMGTWDDVAVFRRAHDAGRLKTRIYAAVPLDTWERLRDTIARREFGGDGRGDKWLRIGALKGFVDGSLGSHTAAFHEPYTDAPHDRGLFVNTPEDLYAWVAGADRAGLHIVIHAIGDRANTRLLDIYERVIRENGPRDRRLRVEHAQHLRPDDLPRFRTLGVIASMQPYHAIDDGRWAEKVIGPVRIQTTYAFRSLLDAGTVLAFGSDWPVAPPTPLEGLYAAVTRRTLDGKNPRGWVPAQKITLEEALRAYTRGAAYAEYAETGKGVLAPGKLADFVVIDRDVFAGPPEAIREAHVDLTVVGGRITFERTATETRANAGRGRG